MESAELKPCPCCGGYAQAQAGKQYRVLIQDWHSAEEERFQPCSVRCRKCGLTITRAACNAEYGGANGASKKAKELAIEAWNTRDTAAIRAECADRATNKFCELSQGLNPNYGCSPNSWCWKKCECAKAKELRAAIMEANE